MEVLKGIEWMVGEVKGQWSGWRMNVIKGVGSEWRR